MNSRTRCLAAAIAWTIPSSLAFRAAAQHPSGARPAPIAAASPSGEPAPGPAAERAAVDLVRTRAAIEAHRVRLSGSLQPSARAKLQEPIRQTAQAAASKTATSAELFDVAARAASKAFANAPKAAVEALGLIALMEAEKDARSEVSEIQSRQEVLRQAKDCRSELSCLERLGAKGGTSKEIAEKAIDDAKNQRDSLRELGETDSRRQKSATDRSSKLASTLSTLLKKIAATSEKTTESLK
ncbi:MAG: hypothetical protein ABW133_25695 [Polyangiaceae bacterium]